MIEREPPSWQCLACQSIRSSINSSSMSETAIWKNPILVPLESFTFSSMSPRAASATSTTGGITLIFLSD